MKTIERWTDELEMLHTMGPLSLNIINKIIQAIRNEALNEVIERISHLTGMKTAIKIIEDMKAIEELKGEKK